MLDTVQSKHIQHYQELLKLDQIDIFDSNCVRTIQSDTLISYQKVCHQILYCCIHLQYDTFDRSTHSIIWYDIAFCSLRIVRLQSKETILR